MLWQRWSKNADFIVTIYTLPDVISFVFLNDGSRFPIYPTLYNQKYRDKSVVSWKKLKTFGEFLFIV